MSRNNIRQVLAAAAVAVLIWSAAAPASAQNFQFSISNEFRYGIGERYEQEKPFRKEYFEDLFNTRIYAGNESTGFFTVGFRAQIDKPREYGRDTIGITEYYAEYVHEGLRARGGTFYNLVGRGLVFNTFESRPIGFETRTQGVKINYENSDVIDFAAGAFGGILTYPDLVNADRLEEYLVRGANAEVRPIPELGVGGSFLAASGRPTRSGFFVPFDAYLREIYLQGNLEGFNAFVNYADRRTQIDSLSRTFTSSPFFGNAWYAMLGYDSGIFGVTAEYKDYRYDVVSPADLQTATRETRALPFQNAPTLIPEYDKTLLARNPHTIDFSDELGFHFETFIYPADALTLNVHASAGSRHNAWTAERIFDSVDGDRTIYHRQNATPLIMPELSDIRYSPYWEIYGQADYEVSDDLTLALGVQRKDNVIYTEGNGEEIAPRTELYKATTLMLEGLAGITERDNLHAILELQRVYDSKKETGGNDSLGIAPYNGVFNNVLLTLEYSQSPRWAINTRIEWTTTDKEQGGQRLWPVIGGTYRIGNSHTIGAQYGSERGGVVCTGGVCRLINPFTGFRLTIESKL